MNFDTNRLLLIYYPQFAGGKFITNCLALSKDAVHINRYLAEIDINFNQRHQIKNSIIEKLKKEYQIWAGSSWPKFDDFVNDNYFYVDDSIAEELNTIQLLRLKWYYKSVTSDINYYDFKLSSSLMSLPPTLTEQTVWRDYEYLNMRFWEDFNLLTTNKSDFNDVFLKNKKFFDTLYDTNKYFFIGVHSPRTLRDFKNFFPNSKIIQFVNYDSFQQIARKLKIKSNDNELYDFNPTVVGINDISLYFNVESILQENHFLGEIKKLYQNLNLTDFNLERILTFYRAYAKLHNI